MPGIPGAESQCSGEHTDTLRATERQKISPRLRMCNVQTMYRCHKTRYTMVLNTEGMQYFVMLMRILHGLGGSSARGAIQYCM